MKIYTKLLYHLCTEHIDYALNVTLQGTPVIGWLLSFVQRCPAQFYHAVMRDREKARTWQVFDIFSQNSTELMLEYIFSLPERQYEET